MSHSQFPTALQPTTLPVTIDEEKCIAHKGCTVCVDVCPLDVLAIDFTKGKAVYEEAQCAACHKFGADGGAVGPDLTAVSSRFHRRDILESILLPSKVISEQYMNTIIRTKSGDVQEGRVLEETDAKVVMQPNPLKPDKVTIDKADIKSRGPSKVSPMPEGLVNLFKKEEILDLIAYIESGGNRDSADFK